MMHNHLEKSFELLLERPLTYAAICLLIMMMVVNSLSSIGAFLEAKAILLVFFTCLLLFVSLKSFKILIYLYVGGALLQGMSFLVPPTALEQKHFFSYFHVLIGQTKLYLTDLFLLVIFCIVPLHFLVRRGQFYGRGDNNSLLKTSLAFFLCYGSVLALLSTRINGKSALGEARTVFFSALFFAAVHVFTTRLDIYSFLRFFVVTTVARTMLNIITVLISTDYLTYQRPFGSNNDAAYCAISLILIVCIKEQLIANSLIRRIIQLWLVFFPILITSRSAVLCLLITIGCYVALSKSLSIGRVLAWVAVGVGGMAILVYALAAIPELSGLYGSRFLSLMQNAQDDPTGNWRLIGWLFAFESILLHPFLGVGFGGYAERFINGEWIKVSLHSAYLDYLYTMGTIGLSLFVIPVISGIAGAAKCYKRALSKADRRLALGICLSLCYLALFIAFNAEMSYGLSGTVMWIFLATIPALQVATAPTVKNMVVAGN